mgnify:CR=1 FL=1
MTKDELKKRKKRFIIILIITIICFVINMIECIIKRNIETINIILINLKDIFLKLFLHQMELELQQTSFQHQSFLQ